MDASACENLENDLFLDDVEDVALAVPEAFRVIDEDTANWVLTKFVEAKARSERAAAWADRIKRQSHREVEHLLFRFELQLREWTQAELGRSRSRRKSITLPSGVLGFRAQKPSLVVDDETAVVAWARSACPSVVVVSERIAKAILNEYVASTGEIPTGTHLEPEREAFYLR